MGVLQRRVLLGIRNEISTGMLSNLRAHLHGLIRGSAFFRGVLALCGGAVGGQLILIGIAPVLTRLYAPEMFGLVAVFIGITTVLGTLVTWRYELAIPQAADDQSASALMMLCLFLTFVTSVVVSLIIWCAHDFIVSLFRLEDIAAYLWLIPSFIFLTGIGQLLTYVAYRQRRFGLVARSSILRSVGMSAVQLSLFSFGALGLLFGNILGLLLVLLVLLRSGRNLFSVTVAFQLVRANAWRFRKYPLYSTWSGVAGSASQQAPILMFATFFSPAEVGLYSLAYRIVGLPGTLIGSAVSSVFLPHAAEASREGRLGDLLLEVHRSLTYIATPVMLGLLLLSPGFFAFAFGVEWKEAGHYAQWLVVMTYISFLYSPVSTAFGILNRQDVGLLLNLSLLISSVVAVWGAVVFFHEIYMAIAMYAAVNSLLCFAALVWLHRQAGNAVVDLLEPMVKALVYAMPVAALLWLTDQNSDVWYNVVLLLAASCYIALYCLPLLRKLKGTRREG